VAMAASPTRFQAPQAALPRHALVVDLQSIHHGANQPSITVVVHHSSVPHTYSYQRPASVARCRNLSSLSAFTGTKIRIH
jgi:hypothetical protein